MKSLIPSLAFTLISALFFSHLASAQEIPFPGGGGGRDLGFILEHQSEAEPDGQPGFGIQEQKGAINIPIYVREDTSLSLFLRGQRTVIDEPLRFTSRNLEVPEEFGTAEIGIGWNKTEENSNKWGGSLSFGSAGQRLLDNGRTPIITGMLTREVNVSEDRSWLYFLAYANNRAVLNNIPIPAVAYSIKGPTTRFLIGLPVLFGNWRPGRFVLSGMLSPFAIFTDNAYRVWGPVMVFGTVAWRPRAYQNLFEGSEDRLIFAKKEAVLGFRMFMGPGRSASVGYVYNFDRRFLIGRSATDTSPDDIHVKDSDGLQLRLAFSF